MNEVDDDDQLETARRLTQSAWRHLLRSPRKSLGEALEAHRLISDRGDDIFVAEALLAAGWATLYLCRFEESLASFEKALLCSRLIGNDDRRLRSLIGIGVVYQRVTQFESALSYFEQVVSESRRLELPETESSAMLRIGEVCTSIQRPEEALQFILRARELAEKIQDGDILRSTDIALGDAYRRLGRQESAMEHLQGAASSSRAENCRIAEADCLTSLGRLYQDLGEDEQAEICHRRSIALYSSAEYRFGLIIALQHIGWLLLQTGRQDEAVKSYLRAVDLAEELEAQAHASRSYLRLSQIFQERGDYQRAIDFLRRYIEYHSMFNDETAYLRVRDLVARSEADSARDDAEFFRERSIELRVKTEELSEANRLLTVIGRVGRDITSARDMQSLVFVVHTAILSLVPIDSLGIGVVDSKNNRLVYRYIIEDGEALELVSVNIDSSESLGAICVREKRELVIGNMEVEKPRLIEFTDMVVGRTNRSALFFPLLVKDRVIGVLTAQSRQRNAYTERDVDTLRLLTSYVAIALGNSIILEDVNALNEALRYEKTELERANETIRHMANHDSLTGLPNRRLLQDLITEYLPLARRQNRIFAIVYLDLDNFKPVNDRYGHTTGDDVLAIVAQRLRESVRASDVVARVGGDEFVILVRDLVDDTALDGIVAKVVSSVKAEITIGDVRIRIEVSFGVSVFPGDGEEFDRLLMYADSEMYKRKQKKSLGSAGLPEAKS